MPFRRRRYPRRRRRAAGTIQRAWRRRARRKKGGLVARTAKANFRAIKKLKRTPELKFSNSFIATQRTMWCGQIISNQKVDSMGYPSDTRDYVAAGLGNQLPDSAYLPLVMQPWVIQQAGNIPTNAAAGTAPAGSTEATRVGNWVKHYNTIFKLTLQGSLSSLNGGLYANAPQKQSLYAYFVLDTDPGREAPELNSAAPVQNNIYIPSRLYPPSTADSLVANGLATGGGLNRNLPQFEWIRSGPKISGYSSTTSGSVPPGLNTGTLADNSLHGVSYYSKDFIGKDKRFRVLKVVKMSCNQQNPPMGTTAPLVGALPSLKTTMQKTVVIKGNYKLQFDGDKRLVPSNHNLLVFFASNVATPATAIATPPATPTISADYVAAPSVTCTARVQFRDS